MPNMPLLPKQPEPVAWRFDGEVAKGVAVTVYKSVANSWIARGYKATPLFELATTQPVIPEQLTVRMAEDKALSLGAVLYDEEADVFADGWNACRAEMLKAQQNEPQNIPENIPAQPVIPEQPEFYTKIDRFLPECLKPGDISGERRNSRITELMGWFDRYYSGKANPKWLKPHVAELCYYILTVPQLSAQPVSEPYKLISVKDDTPTESGDYWCYLGKDFESPTKYRVVHFDVRHHEFQDHRVTNWMRLPAEPAQEV